MSGAAATHVGRYVVAGSAGDQQENSVAPSVHTSGVDREPNIEAAKGIAPPRSTVGIIEDPGTLISNMVRRLQEQASVAPIVWPNEYGAFGNEWLPTIFPVVIDANALRDELLRITRTGQRTILCTAANGGVLRLFCADHVIDEVYEHAAEWAVHAHLEPAAVLASWRTNYLPLLRCVTVPAHLTTSVESRRLAVLADPTSPNGDPDDVPTVTLAMLLGAPLLSRDRNALRAAYGYDFDHQAHGQWLSALTAGGNLGPLSQYLTLGTNLIVGTGEGAYAGLRALAERFSWPVVLAALTGSAALGVRIASPEQRHNGLARVGRFLEGATSTFAAVAALHGAAQEEFDTLATPQPAWDQVQSDLGNRAALTRYCVHYLARSRRSHLSAAELREQVAIPDQIPQGEAKVRAILRGGSCFEQVYRGRFQVGRALVRRPASDTP